MNLLSYPFSILLIGITPSIFHVSFARAYTSSSISHNYTDGHTIENKHSSTQEKRSINRITTPSTVVENKKDLSLLKSEPDSLSKSALGLTSNDQRSLLAESNDSISSRADHIQTDIDKLSNMHETGYQQNKHTSFREINGKARYQTRMAFRFFQSSSSQGLKDIDDDDAADVDADDHGNTEISPELQKHQTSHQGEAQPIQTKPTQWYMLSHYISSDSIIYEVIQGVAVGTIICLILATCYSYTYYCCLVRCGLCLDDRLDASILNTKARKRKRIPIPNRRKTRSGGRKEGLCSYLCSCRYWKGSGGYDGKGFFMPVDTQYADDSSSDDDDEDEDRHSGVYVYKDNDDHSSLSDGSALTLEYGDDHLHDEYGEITNRMNDEKVKIAAKKYFDREELESAKKIKQKRKRKKASREARTHRSRRSQRSHRSRKSERSHRSRKSAGTQTSSILSSSSEHSSSSSSESDGNVTLEMLEAMTDLKEVEQKAKRSNNN